VQFGDLKGVLENLFDHLGLLERVVWSPGVPWSTLHPGKSAAIEVDDALVGIIGALHPDTEVLLDLGGDHWLFELDLDRIAAAATREKRYRGLPRFPAVVRDLALVVSSDFRSADVVRFVREWNRELVEAVHLFDEYVGSPIAPGKKSLAYSIAYRAEDRTLTDEEVNALQDQLVLALEKKFRVEHR
jgi:phenylalanyl-tRNA synthetase beta chain